MDRGCDISFARRDARMAEVRELVEKYIPDPADKLALLLAVSEYGHAAASEAVEYVQGLIRETITAPVTNADADATLH